MSRRWLLAAMAVPVIVLPIFGWRASTLPPLVASTPALAYSPSPTPPQLFPPPGSSVPANTELRVNHGRGYAKLTACTEAKQPIELSDRAIGEYDLAARPVTPPKAGTLVTIVLEGRGDGSVPWGAGVLGKVTWTDRVDKTPPLLTLVGRVTRTDAIGKEGRLMGFPDHLDVRMRVEDESPIAILAQVGIDVPDVGAPTNLYVPVVTGDRTASITIPFTRPSAGVRIAVQALDSAGNTSAWSTTDVIPMSADEASRFPSDAGAASSGGTAAAAPSKAPSSGCSR